MAGAAAIGAAAPADAGALPQRLSEVPVVRLDERLRVDLDAPTPVSISIPNPLPLRDVLLLLFGGTGMSVVVRDGVTGTFAGELKGLTLRQALEAVLFPGGLDYEIDGPIVRVFPQRQDTRFFEVNLAPGRDLFDDLERGVQALLSGTGQSHVDRKAGLVHVTDFRDRLDRVGVYLESVTMRMSRQVLLEARVFEIVSRDPRPIDWVTVARQPGSGVEHLGTAGLRVLDVQAVMRTLGSRGRLHEIGAPRLLAMNNEAAAVRVGVEQVGGGALRGLTLTVTPQIAADGIVTMRVTPAISGSGRGSHGAGSETLLDIAQADTLVRVQDGHTVVISGLLRERIAQPTSGVTAGTSGTPESANEYSEVIVFLTPTVVAPGAPVGAGDR
jgi:type II secretory pathway component HofQ